VNRLKRKSRREEVSIEYGVTRSTVEKKTKNVYKTGKISTTIDVNVDSVFKMRPYV
jgi:hypothetical protein